MNRIAILRKIRGLSMRAVAVELGIPYTTYVNYEKGFREPNSEMLMRLADFFDVSIDYLIGFSDNPEAPDTTNQHLQTTPPTVTEDYTTFPIIGEVAAGYDSIAVEDWEGDTIEIPNSYLNGHSKDEFFVLRVKGSSMYPQYQDGDQVLVLKQPTLDKSGDIGVIIYEDECATLKKVEYVMGEDWLKLIPINPEYEPKLVEGEALEHCRVLGIPRLLIREIGE